MLRSRPSVLVLASSGDKGVVENAQALKDLPGVAVDLKEGEAHGFAFFKDCTDLMAVYFGEYLTYHHTGKTYAAERAKGPAAVPVTTEGITGGQSPAEKKTEPTPVTK